MAREAPLCVGIDWGTTHRRGYLLDGGGACVAEAEDAQGLLASRGRFPAALDEMLAALGVSGAEVAILLSGMVGSAQGWRDAGYLDAPLPLAQLRERLTAVETGARRAAIVPGVALRRGGQVVDVMRGEETQLLGAAALGHGEGWFVLPGTHAKWVRLEGGTIVDFATYLTGELFALLTTQGTLAAAMAGDEHRDAAFAAGLEASADAALSHALFGVRARVVGGAMPADQARSYLSGLLIGSEWHDLQRRCGGRMPTSATLIAAPGLASRYTDAARHFGVGLLILDAHAAYLAALSELTR